MARMRVCSALLVLALILLVIEPPRASGACRLGSLQTLPVTMRDGRPLVSVQVNRSDALFIPDAGAFYSLLTPRSADNFGLTTHASAYDPHLPGPGRPATTTVRTLTLSGLSLADVEFLVAGRDLAGGASGALGRNAFGGAEVEYDLGNGVIRLLRPHDCGSSVLAYWLKAGQFYSILDFTAATPDLPHITGSAAVNGLPVRFMLDPGAPASMLSTHAAQAAGASPDGSGAAVLGSFKIGDEEVKNARVRVGALAVASVDLLLGADFIGSHRLYVSDSQVKLYFTHNGGRVFDPGAAR